MEGRLGWTEPELGKREQTIKSMITVKIKSRKGSRSKSESMSKSGEWDHGALTLGGNGVKLC
jgi:hypothetical protein